MRRLVQTDWDGDWAGVETGLETGLGTGYCGGDCLSAHVRVCFSMAIVEYPDDYKASHIEHLLSSVKAWRKAPLAGIA